MKLLYFINQITNSGGIERIVIDKANFLVNTEGISVSLAYFGEKGDKTFYSIDKKIKFCPITGYTHSHNFRQKIGSLYNVFIQTNNIIEEGKPDIIITANAYIVSWFLPFIKRTIPKIVELHFSYDGLMIMNEDMYHGNKFKICFNTALRKCIYPLYKRCVVLTKDDVEKWGFRNAICIPNFSNIKTPMSQPIKIAKKAINVGRLEFQKDHEILINAWKLVCNRYPDWTLEIWGDGRLREKIQAQIEHLGLGDNVFLKGVSKNIAEQYQQATFFVLSSRYEGQPLVMIEAMQCGLPCISFAITGTRDTIQHGVNGFLVYNRTAENLSKCIINLIESNDKYEDMRQQAIDISKKFKKEIVMQKWINLFSQLSNNEE